MKLALRLLAVAASLSFAHAALAQAPAGSTGQCKDGSYTSSASKSGACRGHQGVKEWYAATSSKSAAAPAAAAAAAPAAAAKTATAAPAAASSAASSAAAAPAAAAKTAKTSTANMTQAAGGGPGMVWVNTSSKVYHCPDSKYYGKTKEGKYMSEADAKASGAHADHGHACSK